MKLHWLPTSASTIEAKGETLDYRVARVDGQYELSYTGYREKFTTMKSACRYAERVEKGKQ